MYYFQKAFLVLFFVVCASPAFAQDTNWADINTTGLLAKDATPFQSDLWDNYNQAKAVSLLEYMPNRLRSAAYKSAVRKFLLTSTAPFDEDIKSPKYLFKRLELLIRYGLFEDARNLYEKIGNDADSDFDLALIGIALTLLNKDLPATCLDVQALSGRFTNMPQWVELADFCSVRFGGNDSLKNGRGNFEQFPYLNTLLSGQTSIIPDSISWMELLIAHADNAISDTAFQKAARHLAEKSDLLIALGTMNGTPGTPTRQCYMLEASVRGIVSTDQLKKSYEQHPFSKEMLEGRNGTVNIHPCDVPAYFYQRLVHSNSQDSDINTLLKTTVDMPVQALLPFEDVITKQAETTPSYQWIAGILAALSNDTVLNTPITSPLRAIQTGESLSNSAAETWKNTYQSIHNIPDNTMDYALPVYISSRNTLDYRNILENQEKFNYENFYSLTYVNKSVHSSLGMNDALRQFAKDEDVAKMFVTSLSTLGKYSPSSVSPKDLTGIIASFDAAKLTNEKHAMAIEALH